MDDLQYYENPETGGVFGFGEPLPASIVDQIKAGMLRPCDPSEDVASVPPQTDPEPKADGNGKDDGGTDAATPVETPADTEALVLPELAEPEGFRERHTARKPRR